MKASQVLEKYEQWLGRSAYKNKAPYMRAATAMLRKQNGSFDLPGVVNDSIMEEGLSTSTLRLRKVFGDFVNEGLTKERLVEADLEKIYRVGDSELVELYGCQNWFTNRWLGYLISDLKAGLFYPVHDWVQRHSFTGINPGLAQELVGFIQWVQSRHHDHADVSGQDLRKIEHELHRLIVDKQLNKTKERLGNIQERKDLFKHEVLAFSNDAFERFLLFALGENVMLTAADLQAAQVRDVLSGSIKDKEISPVAILYYREFLGQSYLREREPALGYKVTRNDITRIVNKYLASIGCDSKKGLIALRARLGYNEKALTEGKRVKSWLESQGK